MFFKFPKNDSKFAWTQHIKDKMLFYHISEQKIKTVIKSHDRKEQGIAPNTLAVMKRNDTPKRKEEIWVMYQKMSKIILISAWRYPGISKKGAKIPVPDEILAEIQNWFKKKGE